MPSVTFWLFLLGCALNSVSLYKILLQNLLPQIMVQVKVYEGVLVGEKVISTLAGTFYSFKGIPYAAPPVGDLRFKAPQPPKPWEGERSAKQFGPQCPQYNFITRIRDSGNEDCLYLNIYTPNISPPAPLPVMIYIHGGGLISGNANDDMYGPEFLIRHGVILVTFNYRLEVLGFLCLDSEDVPGNAGIKDQVAAMKWVKDNISSFGGDPKNITIFGQSSGGACVTYHCVSPMTKGLFRRAIAQSGSMLNWWASTYKPRDRAIALAKKLGCTSEDDKELYNFFKAQPWDNLVGIQVPILWRENFSEYCPAQFGVVSEKRFPNTDTFFSGDIIEALRNDIHEGLELIIGANEDEGIIMLAHSNDMERTINSANYSEGFFTPMCFSYSHTLDEVRDAAKKLKSFYTQDKTIGKSDLRPLTKYCTIELYKYGILHFAKFFAAKNKTVYLYKFSCQSERNLFTKIFGLSSYFPNETVCHNDEIAYLFPLKCINQVIPKSSDTFIMIDRMTKLWTNFAKFGNPTPDTKLGCNWKHFNAKAEPYLNIGDKLVRGMGYIEKEEIELWDSMYDKYCSEQMYRPN